MYSDHDYDGSYYDDGRRMDIFSSADLLDLRIGRICWIVQGLLKPGLSVLAGAPKIGKSWMVLQLCLAVAKGEPFLGMETDKGTVLYVSLEDSKKRIQERMYKLTEDGTDKMMISLSCSPLGEMLRTEIVNFCRIFQDTRLVVIDTFQKIREQAGQMSYAGDYADVSAIKQIADELNIAILLVHHTRKMGDSDYINEISGTNGIAGSADTLMLLKKEKRADSKAILSCTGRDVEDREMELNLNRESCRWEVVSDHYAPQRKEMPPLLIRLIGFVRRIKRYEGDNTTFVERFSADCGEPVNTRSLKQQMNLFRYELEDAGVHFRSVRNHDGRRLDIRYQQPEAKPDKADREQVQEPQEDHGLPASEPKQTEKPLVGLPLPPDEAEEEGLLWENAFFEEMPPTPGDEDAPPENYDVTDRFESRIYKPYR